MAIPRYILFVEPILRYLSQRTTAVPSSEALEAAAVALSLTEADRAVELASGGPVYRNRGGWAYNLLKRNGLATAGTPGEWQLTKAGLDYASARPVLTREHIAQLVQAAKPSPGGTLHRPQGGEPQNAEIALRRARRATPEAGGRGNRKAYRLNAKPVAVGGQAEVFEATRKADQQIFIFKRARDSLDTARMRREIEVQSILAHPNIMPILDWDPFKHSWFIMPRGRRVLANLSRPIPRELLCAILRDVAAGLRFAHAAGHPHRDIKPDNIIEIGGRGEEVRWVVADWGLTRRSPGDTTDNPTRTGEFLGTLAFAPPEAHQDAHRVGPVGDIYALGKVIAWALGVVPKALVGPVVEPPWSEVVEPMTRQIAAERPQTIGEVLNLLEGCCCSK